MRGCLWTIRWGGVGDEICLTGRGSVLYPPILPSLAASFVGCSSTDVLIHIGFQLFSTVSQYYLLGSFAILFLNSAFDPTQIREHRKLKPRKHPDYRRTNNTVVSCPNVYIKLHFRFQNALLAFFSKHISGAYKHNEMFSWVRLRGTNAQCLDHSQLASYI